MAEGIPHHRFKLPSTTASLAGLVAGIAVGCSLRLTTQPVLHGISEVIEAFGLMWMRALQAIVLPLIITQLLVVVTVSARGGRAAEDGAAGAGRVGGLGAWSLGIFVSLLILGAAFTVIAAPPLLQFVSVSPETVEAIQPEIPEAAQAAAERGSGVGFSEWIVNFVPTNVFAAAANGDLLPIILFTLLFGFAITHVASSHRVRLTEIVEGLAAVVLVMIQWILWFTPVAVFALALLYTRQAGIEVAGILIAFALICSGLLVAFTVVLYPIATIIGRVPLGDFARSLYRAQIVAVSTRSSLATLPALIDGARCHTRIPPEIFGFALPFSASTFKVNMGVSSTTKLLFLAYVYQVHLGAGDIIVFVVTVIILSFTSVGLPRGAGSFKNLPAYVAAGIPVEGVVLLEAIEVIPDIFKTLINSTGYMTVAALLSRRSAAGREEAGAPPGDAGVGPPDVEAAVYEAPP